MLIMWLKKNFMDVSRKAIEVANTQGVKRLENSEPPGSP